MASKLHLYLICFLNNAGRETEKSQFAGSIIN